jgi:hypothetical protein
MRPDLAAGPIVTFHRVYPGATPIMPADRSALGTIPAAALQYCEPVCSASAFGWYVFPPANIRLLWNGVDVFHDVDGQWEPLASIHLPDILDHWNSHCPDDLKDMAPPFLTSLFVPGLVQIWSGMLASTAEAWSLLVRPLANVAQSRFYSCFEGLIETDKFKPMPLFMNIKLMATDVAIEIPKTKPLFQVQPILRSCYASADCVEIEGADKLTEADWIGYRKRIRSSNPGTDSHTLGEYAVSVRKRGKQVD